MFRYNLRFPGQYYDKDTQTDYNFNRDYDPETGRYIQSDPIGLDGGLNSYLYVNAKPISSLDQNGKFGFALPALGIAEGLAEGFAAIGGVVGVMVSNAITNSSSDNRGRIQIQNNSGYDTSRAWALPTPPTLAQGTSMLGELWTGLATLNKKMRKRLEVCGAFFRAERFILSGTKYAPLSKSFTYSPNQRDGERIDFEIIKGSAF